jgi:endonuclease YncB( thermonuclease family)
MLNFPSAVFLGTLLLLSHPANAGSASVINGDTLEWKGEWISLQGVDAPELDQPCDRDGKIWLCGKEARKALAGWLGDRDVVCIGDERDTYGRLLAYCSVDGKDVGKWVLERGLAIANGPVSYEHQEAEHRAKSDKVGVWAGDFEKPWKWQLRKHLEVKKEK